MKVVHIECSAFQQLNYELDAGQENLQMGTSGASSILDRFKQEDVIIENESSTDFFGQSSMEFMDWWTIFYWGELRPLTAYSYSATGY